MAEACVDTLQDLSSEISSEVEEQEQQEQQAPPWVVLDPAKQIDEVVIHYAVMTAKSFAAVFVEGGKWLLELKARFGVKQGTRGKQLKVEGNLIYWDQFCDEYLHITADYFKQLVAKEKNPPSEPKPDDEKPLYKKGYLAGQEKLKTELLAKGVDIEEVVPAPENPKPFKHPSGTPTGEDLWSLSELDQYAANWADYAEAASELLTRHARTVGLYKKFEVAAPASAEGAVEVDIVL